MKKTSVPPSWFKRASVGRLYDIAFSLFINYGREDRAAARKELKRRGEIK